MQFSTGFSILLLTPNLIFQLEYDQNSKC